MALSDSRRTHAAASELLTVIAAGAALLLVVHTLGRFIYTPMLPYLVGDGAFNASEGASIATWNYLGYLLGALLAIRWHGIAQIRFILPLALAVHLFTTLLQTQIESVTVLAIVRCVNGIANGAVFVQAPALILEWLVRRNRSSLSGLVYLGVGVGLLVSSALVSVTAGWLSGPARWWPAFLVSVPLVWWGWRVLSRLDVPARPETEATSTTKARLLDRASAPLFLAYAGGGLGYILPMTFLPLLAGDMLPAEAWLIDGSWLIVALATIPSAWFWNYLGGRMGDLRALRINFAVQAFGAVAVVIWSGTVGITLCAALIGGTFLGTVLLTQRIARNLHPHQGPRLSAAMVAVYAFAQMAGPWLAKQWLGFGGTLQSAFWIGVGALVFGFLCACLVPSPETWHARRATP